MAYFTDTANELLRRYDVHSRSGRRGIYQWIAEHPDDPAAKELQEFFMNGFGPAMAQDYQRWLDEQSLIDKAQQTGDWNQAYMDASSSGVEISPDLEKSIDNQIARENTSNAQNFEEFMRNTSVTSTADQLSGLGLSISNVVPMGAASSNGVAAPVTSMHSAAATRQQARLNAFNNKMSLARSLIGAAGSMASSGIYGAALGAIRHSAAKVAAATAHSGLKALDSMRPELREQLMIDEARRSADLPRYY